LHNRRLILFEMERPRRAAASVAAAAGAYVEGTTSIRYDGSVTSPHKVQRGKRKQASEVEEGDEPQPVAAAAAGASKPPKKARGTSRGEAAVPAAASAAPSATSAAAAASESAEVDAAAFEAATKPGFRTLVSGSLRPVKSPLF